MKVAFQAIYELETTLLIANDNSQVRQRMWLLWVISRSEIQRNAFIPLLCGYCTHSNILTMVNCETYLSKHLNTVITGSEMGREFIWDLLHFLVFLVGYSYFL